MRQAHPAWGSRSSAISSLRTRSWGCQAARRSIAPWRVTGQSHRGRAHGGGQTTSGGRITSTALVIAIGIIADTLTGGSDALPTRREKRMSEACALSRELG